MVAALVANVKSGPDYEKYSEVLDKWDYSKVAMSFIKVVEPMRNGFRVLNHGDVWVNNFLFKYEEGNLTDVQFIDYQLSFWGSPASDLLCFLITSIQDEDKLQNFDYLVEFYHRELVSSLKKLYYQKPIPSLADLHVDLLEKGSFGRSPANTPYIDNKKTPLSVILLLMTTLLVSKHDSTEELRYDQMMQPTLEQKILLEKVYKIDNFTNAIKLRLPFMKERRFLNTLIYSLGHCNIDDDKI
jgi:hypothetical protein